ncbi:MAG TPA: hypothetical protein V6D23_00300 [Candidatus Obscuribacterales bacterium]
MKPYRYALVCLLLSACLTPSPLTPGEMVSITGRLAHEDGTAWADLNVLLKPPFAENKSTRSNAAGIYRFSLSGGETQVAGLAADMEVLASGPEGQLVRQGVKALKTDVQLPAMYFWDGLQTPATDTVLSGNRSVFSWLPPASAVRYYRFSLRNPADELIWQSQSALPNLELPLAVMDAGKAYSWQVTAFHSDYEAASRRRPLRAEPLLRPVSIRAIRGPDGTDYSSLHDGSFSFELADRLTYPETGKLELLIELDRPIKVQGLHWAGSSFAADLELRTSPQAEPIVSHQMQDFTLLEWQPVETDRLYLRLHGESGRFVDLAEIRLLGP